MKTRNPLSRRDFLSALGAGAATLGAGAGCTNVSPGSTAVLEADALEAHALARGGELEQAALRDGGDAFGRAMRRLFLLDSDVLYMNVGTVGSTPREVLDVYDDENRELASRPASTYGAPFKEVRAALAPDFGCDPDELVIAHNTSDAMSKILAGLELRAGDVILTTNHEHDAAEAPMAQLRDRHGVRIERVVLPLGDDQRAEDYVDRFRAAIGPSTKVMLFSAPTYKTGTMLPIRMLAELAHAHGLVTIVDGAHLPGMMRVDLHAWGIDFFAGSGGKWQCGPAGTGLLYIRNKVLPEYNPLPLPAFWPTISSEYPAYGGLPPRTTTRDASYDIGDLAQGIGNGSIASMAAFRAVCALWNRIGRDRIEAYVLGLSAYLKDAIAARWGAGALFSPRTDVRLRSALTSFNPFDRSELPNAARFKSFVTAMADEHDIVVRSTEFPVDASGTLHHAIRVSTHLFHTRRDVDRAVAAMWRASR